MLEEVINNIQKDIEKELNKIKPLKKIKEFNKKHEKILYENEKLTDIGAYIIFLEMYEITQTIIKENKK